MPKKATKKKTTKKKAVKRAAPKKVAAAPVQVVSKDCNCNGWVSIKNRILLGLLMLVPGLLKLFVMGPAQTTSYIGSLGIPAPQVMAWLLIIGELVAGILILANFKLRIAASLATIILLVATIYQYIIPGDPNMVVVTLTHLALISNYWVVAQKSE